MDGSLNVDGMLNSSHCRAALEHYLRSRWRADSVQLEGISKLTGGAIQENWGLAAVITGGVWAGRQDLVLRTDASSVVTASMNRMQEFAVLKAVCRAGVLVPEPLLLCEDPAIIGRRFYLMRRLPGIAAGHRLVRDPLFDDPARGDALVERLGEELARIHRLEPPLAGLEFLPVPEGGVAAHRITVYRGYLDALVTPQPLLEWALCWLEDHQPDTKALVLCHTDYRTGNYLVDQGRLSGILDWEFASYSDPDEDLGWFCARCWRFGRLDREAGGVGTREAFYRGYARESGREVDADRIPYWEIMATVRWALIALQQGQRCFTDRDQALELALTGHLVAELEYDILNQIREQAAPC